MDGRLSAYQTRSPLSKSRVKTGYNPSDSLAEAYPAPTAPVTSYTSAYAPIHSHLDVPATRPTARGAHVERRERMNGLAFSYGYGAMPVREQAQNLPPKSSAFQNQLSMLEAHVINSGWYIAYPAATVMNGGQHNLGISEKTPQLNTRIVGGPGVASMARKPAFSRVQNVPRYSAVPQQYNTTSAVS